jgi:hypothetical protein
VRNSAAFGKRAVQEIGGSVMLWPRSHYGTGHCL